MVTKKDETPDVADEAEGQPAIEVEEDVDVDETIEIKPEGNRISLPRGAAYRSRTRTRRLTARGRASTSGPGSDDGHHRPRAVAGDRSADRGGLSARGRASSSGPGSDDGHHRPRAVAGDCAAARAAFRRGDARSGCWRTRCCRS